MIYGASLFLSLGRASSPREWGVWAEAVVGGCPKRPARNDGGWMWMMMMVDRYLEEMNGWIATTRMMIKYSPKPSSTFIYLVRRGTAIDTGRGQSRTGRKGKMIPFQMKRNLFEIASTLSSLSSSCLQGILLINCIWSGGLGICYLTPYYQKIRKCINYSAIGNI